jgi:hypothetical protein
MKLKPKNWGKFQHYKDRCPPWIKLHRDILNDRMFANLPIASKALAPLLWLLASESKDGSFDAASEELAFRLHIASKDIEAGLKPLIDKGFFVDASTMLAPCLQSAIPERETERETETERKKKVVIPDWIPEEAWDNWISFRKAKGGITEHAKNLCISNLEKLRQQGNDPVAVINQSIMNGWAGLFPLRGDENKESGGALPTWAPKRAVSV